MLAGSSAPAWAKEIGEGPVQIYDDEKKVYVDVGAFWEPVYQQAYADLQVKLARKYDGLAIISDVTISGCMTIFAEPMIRQVGDDKTRENLLKAKYTKDKDIVCQNAAIQAHTVWEHTRSSLAANPFQFVRTNGSGGADVDESLRILTTCRNVLGSRCVLENNSLREEYLSGTGDYQKLYAGMLQRGGPIVFQTATPERLGNIVTVLNWAVQNGIGAIELPQTYPRLLTSDQISDYDRDLAANAARADAAP